MPWDPEQYLRFRDERYAPFDDLLSLITPRTGMSVIDLGCGTGELTRRLADYLPGSRVTGIDSSPRMLEKASDQERDGLAFLEGDIENVSGNWDLVFSNAAIQWVDDHEALVPRLLSLVSPGGQLAVQIPANHRHPSLTMIRATAEEEPFSSALDGWTRVSPVLEIDRYAELLFLCGGTSINVFEKVYCHILEDAEAIVQWTRGTALVPYLEKLPDDLHGSFLDSYQRKLASIWPRGPILFTFRRIFISAFKGL
jgi:trans-aconitate 2-methyltransferase